MKQMEDLLFLFVHFNLFTTNFFVHHTLLQKHVTQYDHKTPTSSIRTEVNVCFKTPFFSNTFLSKKEKTFYDPLIRRDFRANNITTVMNSGFDKIRSLEYLCASTKNASHRHCHFFTFICSCDRFLDENLIDEIMDLRSLYSLGYLFVLSLMNKTHFVSVFFFMESFLNTQEHFKQLLGLQCCQIIDTGTFVLHE